MNCPRGVKTSGNGGLAKYENATRNLQLFVKLNFELISMTRGIRNNNPLNIRRSSTRWQGARKEQTDKSFVQFETMAYGYRAAWKILQTYYERFCTQGKPFTVRNIIERWAPPTENDTEAYIKSVLKLSSIGGKEKLLPPSNVLSYGRLSRLVIAMTCIECGLEYNSVDTASIAQGYKLAFPANREKLDEWLLEEDEYRYW